MNANTPNNSPILRVHDLSVAFSGETILDHVSFELYRGMHLTVIGPNGSGKTTLLRALVGVIPHRGEVVWGKGVRLGYVPQRLDIERGVPLSLRDFLESKSARFSDGALETYLELLHVPAALLSRPLGSLSGGEFQRALVAFALLGDSNVLLFDEPTTGIDKPREEHIYETIHRLQDERGVTVITVSHDLSLVNRYADQVLCLNRRGICFGTPKEVLKQETLADLYGDEEYKFFHHIHDSH